ncbi:Trichothecene 3-o-acetyltransferase [Neofusicoccum parvum]|uniref:Trichothecene 3-o-acetyltransferase n=1 Tax=Neofusicoccum parvum TaxID=310453 RepID=A0ACB5RT41_9PEZI|nr:Trichothecene 3-o-acetyltransferase [Neofusicoccum parvum]
MYDWSNVKDGPNGGIDDDVLKMALEPLPKTYSKGLHAEKILRLGIFDQTMLRKDIPLIFCFSMPDQRKETLRLATEVLRYGLQVALQRWPFLAGKLHEENEENSSRKNLLELRYTDPPADVVQSGVFHAQTVSSLRTFQELSDMGMPPSALDGFLLTGRVQSSSLDLSLPVLKVQANFIEGGLLLAFAFAHPVLDGVSLQHFFDHFSHCTRQMPVDEGKPSAIRAHVLSPNGPLAATTPAEIHPRILPTFQTPLPPSPPADLCPEFNPTPTPTRPLDNGPPTARIFTFPAQLITNLKTAITAHIHAHHLPGWISTHDALSALLWTAIARARAPRLPPHTRFCCTANARPALALPPAYIGNAVAYALATFPAATLTTPPSVLHTPTLAAAALAIRAALVAATTPAYLRARLARLAAAPDVAAAPVALAAAVGMGCAGVFLTSWVAFGADAVWGVPGVGEGERRARWVRKPWCASEGCVNVLPRREGAAWEVLVGLAEGEMGALVGVLGEVGAGVVE